MSRKMPADVAAALAFLRNPDGKGETRVFSGFSGEMRQIGGPMVVCPTCGNKRCPKATDVALDCTGSNEPGQPGSAYGKAP